jgi:peptide chain release factor 3
MANDKSIVDEAYPGDVVGLYDTDSFKIGDTLTEGEKMYFKGIPSFSPELFKEIINTNPLKTKQLEKGIQQLTDEGVAQLFVQYGINKIIGTVGELQFDVIAFRLQHEYGASCKFQPLRYQKASWFTCDNKEVMDKFLMLKSNSIVYDKENRPVFMAESDWGLNMTKETYPEIKFYTTSEFRADEETYY